MPTGVRVVQPPVGEPVSLAEARLHLRIDPDDTSQDPWMASAIRRARQYVENWSALQLVSATLQTVHDRFPRYSSSATWQYNSDAIWQQRLPVTQLSGQWFPDRASFRTQRSPLQQLLAISFNDGQGIVQSLVNQLPAGVPAPGTQAVVPASMAGIVPNLALIVDIGPAQEQIVVGTTTATSFTATFANAHPAQVPVYGAPGVSATGTVLNGGALVDIDTASVPGRIAPGYGQIWPIVRQKLASVQITYGAGYGPVTSVASSVAPGTQAVSPASPAGITVGTRLAVDDHPSREDVVVTAITATSFTALFALPHTGPFPIYPGVPESLRGAILFLVGYWFENRGDELLADATLRDAVRGLLWADYPAEYT